MIIYKITNKINGKVYIGQTTQSIEKRWKGHYSKAFYEQKSTVIYNAIRKYGPENFTIEEIDGANSLSELNYLETHYIYKYESLAPNGYNLSSGGRNKKHHYSTIIKLRNNNNNNKIYCIDNSTVYSSISEASRELKIPRKIINDNVLGKIDTAYGLVFQFVDIILREKAIHKSIKRKENRKKQIDKRKESIICLETNTVYNSIKEAAFDLKISESNINSVLSGECIKSKGFGFKYLCANKDRARKNKRNKKLNKEQILEKTKKATSKPIKCLNNDVIYPSIKEASKNLNIHHNSIRNMLSGRSRTAGGLKFEYFL